MPERLRQLAGGTLVSLLLVVLTAGPASAHAALVGSNPAEGDRLDAAPSELRLEFNEAVGNAAVVLSAPDGSEVPLSEVRAVDREVTTTPTDVDQAGIYSLSYRVVSADGHPIQDTITYTVTSGQEVEQQAPAAAPDDEQGFVHRHRTHLFWGVLAVAVALGLLLMPIRGRDSDS